MSDFGPSESVSHAVSDRPATIDVDLFCPHCDYNLRGLAEDRCPECGDQFDRATLSRWTLAQHAPLGLDWHGNQRSLWQIWLACLMRPQTIGRELPPFPSREESAGYSVVTRSSAAFIATATISLITRDESGYMFLFAWIGPIAATLLCETIIAALLARLVEPMAVPPGRRYRFWRALCTCFSAHFPVSCLVVPALGFGIAMSSMGGYLGPPQSVVLSLFYELAPFAGLAVMMAWWWWGLGRAVAARGNPCPGRTAAVLLIPVVGAISIVLGMLLAAVLGSLCARGLA